VEVFNKQQLNRLLKTALLELFPLKVRDMHPSSVAGSGQDWWQDPALYLWLVCV